LLESLKNEAAAVREQTTAVDRKRLQYVQVSKWLNTVKQLRDVYEESMALVPWRRKHFLSEHREELEAYDHASNQLQKLGISPEIDLDKVEAMIGQQDERIVSLKEQEKNLDQRITRLQMAMNEVNASETSKERDERGR
jgi:hypothetical protein